MDFERRLASGASRPDTAGLRLVSLALLAALAGACTTTAPAPAPAPAPGTTKAVARTAEVVLFAHQEAVRLDPTNADLWLQLGQTYEKMGSGADALESLQKGLEVDPGNAGILNHMAWFYATTEDPALRDPAKALAYAQRAVEASNGKDANFLDTLAEAYYANQEFDEAIETEERALDITPGVDAYQNQLEKFRDAKAAESGS
jgi:tetratricopeptide (TPR) repeat protein